jgi:DNA polymerase-4
VQRILGGRAGRLLSERARGADPRPVTPTGLPAQTSESRSFASDVLDPVVLRAVLLEIAGVIGARLRRRHQIAVTLQLEAAFADGSTISRTGRLPEPSHHDDDLRAALYRLFAEFALQRARVRQITVTASSLVTAGSAGGQISFDRARESRLRAEVVMDEVTARFGAGSVKRGTLARRRTAG